MPGEDGTVGFGSVGSGGLDIVVGYALRMVLVIAVSLLKIEIGLEPHPHTLVTTPKLTRARMPREDGMAVSVLQVQSVAPDEQKYPPPP
eukprot:m.910701 g.910701  ORF g.910701 m.910701 type:complete len:89 (+) comp60112_c0_seq19:364-630(+)